MHVPDSKRVILLQYLKLLEYLPAARKFFDGGSKVHVFIEDLEAFKSQLIPSVISDDEFEKLIESLNEESNMAIDDIIIHPNPYLLETSSM